MIFKDEYAKRNSIKLHDFLVSHLDFLKFILQCTLSLRPDRAHWELENLQKCHSVQQNKSTFYQGYFYLLTLLKTLL